MKTITGVLLVNLGTPDSPNPKDVHRYLIEFLTDPRVINSSWLSRQMLVRGIIVPARYRQSAKAYKEIWSPEGSPLKVYGHRTEKALQSRLGDEFKVVLAMRYQNPSIQNGLDTLKQLPLKRLIILPLFPQYASATTGSVHQQIMEKISRWEVIPQLKFIDQFATHPGLIKAFCQTASTYNMNDYDHVLFSFHGLPRSQILKADPSCQCFQSTGCCKKLTKDNHQCYSAQCHATAHEIAKGLNLENHRFSISFQSRLGKDPWLEPFTNETIQRLAKAGKKRLLVFSPAFVCDCLETLYEIGIEYAAEFKHAGGERLDLVPGLNDHPSWIDALQSIVEEH